MVLVITFFVCSGAYAAKVYPIVSMDLSALIGGTVNGKWVDYDDIKGHLKGGEKYRIYSMTKYLGEGIGSKPNDEQPGPSPTVEIKSKSKISGAAFGVAGGWNALPRIPRIASNKQKVYMNEVNSILKKKKLTNAKVNITQVIRVDLDGDKQDEVLISAVTPREEYAREGPQAKSGDYSFVFMRKIVKGKVKTIMINGVFYSKDHDFETDPVAPDKYKVAAVLDLDGDGKMEIIIRGEYYEGIYYMVYKLNGSVLKEVACGGLGG